MSFSFGKFLDQDVTRTWDSLDLIFKIFQDFWLAVNRQIYESCSLRSHRPGKYKFIEEQQQIYSELFMN